jgi:hypothetical protein
MIVRAQRFSRAPRLLPRIARRTITEETPRVLANEDANPSAGAIASESQEVLHAVQMRKKLDLRREAIESLKLAVLKPVPGIRNHTSEDQSPASGGQGPTAEAPRSSSEVYWALADGYEFGGHLEFGNGPLNRHNEKGLPTWGGWGICVRIKVLGGSSTLTL